MALDFIKYANKGNQFVKQLATRLGDEEDTQRAGRVLRSVLRVFRNHLTFEESMQFIAQLPIVLKGVYVDGWKLNESPGRIHSLKDMAIDVLREEGAVAWRDFSTLDEAVDAIKAVWATLRLYVSEGELEDIAGVLPKRVRQELC